MSLWLESYAGYDMNIIVSTDSQEDKLDKLRHVIGHLSMEVFYRMQLTTRHEFAKEAKEQFDGLSDPKYSFSIAEILAFPLVSQEEDDLPLEQQLEHLRKGLKERQEIVDTIAVAIKSI